MVMSLDFNKKKPTSQEQINGQLMRHLDINSRMLAKTQLQLLALARHLKLSAKELSDLFIDEPANQAFYKEVYEEQTKAIKDFKLKEDEKNAKLKSIMDEEEKA